jgi:23S rRNA (cytidine1920-2'-O)/16S rRNA (cytidine1409-2'-O)-methyltransferase
LPAKNEKKRLDILLVEKKMVESRQRSQTMILAGRVLVNGLLVDKPGRLIAPDDHISIKGEDIPFVSRGGLKLAHGLKQFNVDVNGLTCLDVGASTGGFTDCLLQSGAAHVFAVDVGYGQLAWRLRNTPRVTVIERSNIRYLDAGAIPCPIDLTVIDVSFISLKIVVPAVLKFMKTPSRIIALIKPQFEVGKGQVGKGGIVHDEKLHQQVIEDLCDFFSISGLIRESVIVSPISGAKGNKEFIISLICKS